MEAVSVATTISNPADRSRSWTGPFLVDGSTIDSVVPRSILSAIGIVPERTRIYELANGAEVPMDIATARIELMGELSAGLVVFADAEVEPLLGATVLESVGVEVDLRNQWLTKLPPARLKGRRRPGSIEPPLAADKTAVPETGFGSLDEALWKRLVSVHGMRDPVVALEKMGLIARDEQGTPRATVAGLLLCVRAPEERLTNACVTATCYRGSDRASMQIDAEEICGPLDRQISATVAFVLRNMRVAARKEPGRVDLPQYSDRAVFEAVVNAVAHRDYSLAERRTRVSVFDDRVEVQSPGALANGLRIDIMDSQQATRNEALASALARMDCTDVRGSGDRQYFMEKRGDGVGIIRRETESLGAKPPFYQLVGNTDLLLTVPAAPLGWTPGHVALTVRCAGRPVADADILLIFPDGTYRRAAANVEGAATASLHSTHLPMTLFAAAPGFAAQVVPAWVPMRDDLSIEIELRELHGGGSVIFAEGAGELPGLRARLNPVRDDHDRTSLYVSGATVNQGVEQPVHFAPDEELQLTDAVGTVFAVRIPEVLVRATIVEYEPR